MPDSTTGTDWELTRHYLNQHPSRWGSLSWIAGRTLISSINDVLAGHAGSIVNDLRRHYLAGAPDPSFTVDAPQVSSFVLIGDTGEADASQYVVGPALSRTVRDQQVGFVVIASDVIYPSGDVNDYLDAVYTPYRSTDSAHFHVDAPLLGQPGNHDWYDGLYGFMFHFCGRDAKPQADLYAPTGPGFVERLCRILWRRPSSARGTVPDLRATRPLAPLPQPGPYYSVRTRDVRLVCIDTGIAGTIDPTQMAWLERVSAEPGPKLLVTGSPLLVNARREQCAVDPPDPGRTASVWDIVNDPAHHYVATVGGDVHNFQRYPGSGPPGTPQVHLVSGGGGAFTHALHPIDLAANDSRVDPDEPTPAPDLTFPTTHESFAFFARELVPSVWRIMRMLGLFILGTLVTTATVEVAARLGDTVAGSGLQPLARLLGWLTAGALVVLLVVRLRWRRSPRSSESKRVMVAIAALLVGMLAAFLSYRLDAENHLAYVGLWLLATAWHVTFGWGISRTGWWLPRRDHPEEREVSTWVFLVGIAVLLAPAFGLQAVVFPALGARVMAAVSTVLLAAVAVIGWYLRRSGGARWRRLGAPIAVAAQIVYFGAAILQLAVSERLVAQYVGGLLGIVVFVGLILVSALLLVGITGILARIPNFGPTRRAAWSRAAAFTHHLPLVLLGGLMVGWCLLLGGVVLEAQQFPLVLVGGLSVIAALWLGGGIFEAAIALPLAITVFVSLLFFTDLMRRLIGRAYQLVVLAAVLLGVAAAYAWSGWPVREAIGAALAVTALLVSVVLAHLVFLGGYSIVFDRAAHRGRIEFTEAELSEIFAAKTERPRPRVPRVSAQVQRWAQLTYPGIGEPGGPLQRRVAEIYSRDVPPFHKGFLHVATENARMRITLHKVFGDRPSEAQLVADLSLT